MCKKNCGLRHKEVCGYVYTKMLCSYCNLSKEYDEFRKGRLKCRSCEKEDGRKYYTEHKEKRKKWAHENKAKMKELQSNWYQNNKDKYCSIGYIPSHYNMVVKLPQHL